MQTFSAVYANVWNADKTDLGRNRRYDRFRLKAAVRVKRV